MVTIAFALAAPAAACSLVQSWDGYGGGGPGATDQKDAAGDAAPAPGDAAGGDVVTPGVDAGSDASASRVLVIAGGGVLDGSAPTMELFTMAVESDGGTTGWVAGGQLPMALHSHTMIGTAGAVVVIGGTSPAGPTGGVWTAALQPDGGLAQWAPQPAVPEARARMVAVQGGTYLYALGLSSARTGVSYAALSVNGTVGSWEATQSLPILRDAHCAAAGQGHVYVMGGEGTGRRVDFARANSDGTLGAWAETTMLPEERNSCAAAVANGRLVVFGGSAPGPSNTVRYATINPDGSVGTWSSYTGMITPRMALGFAYAKTPGAFFVAGGNTTGGPTAAAEAAAVAPNLTWQALAPMPERRAALGLAVVGR
jgi:hypothetical protein